MSDILWRRLRYMLSPQWDIYHALAAKVKNLSVLDVGCGTGIGTLQLGQTALMATGIDVDLEAVSFAQTTLGCGSVWFVPHDILEPWAVREPFDAVVMVEVLEHIEEYDRALANVRARLKPGGKLYITARNANADLRPNGLHLREWTAGEFRDALEKHFDSVELWNWNLSERQTDQTRATPLVAVAGVGVPVEAELAYQMLNEAGPY